MDLAPQSLPGISLTLRCLPERVCITDTVQCQPGTSNRDRSAGPAELDGAGGDSLRGILLTRATRSKLGAKAGQAPTAWRSRRPDGRTTNEQDGGEECSMLWIPETYAGKALTTWPLSREVTHHGAFVQTGEMGKLATVSFCNRIAYRMIWQAWHVCERDT